MVAVVVPRKCGGSLLVKLLLTGCCTCLVLIAHYCYRTTAFDLVSLRQPDSASAKQSNAQNLAPLTRPAPAKIWQNWNANSLDLATNLTHPVDYWWRAANPEWRSKPITNANLDQYAQDLFPDTILPKAFAKIKKTQLKVDLLRYFILFKQGGVWADMDVVPRQPISKWIPEPFRDWGVNLVVGVEVDNHKQPIWDVPAYSVQLCQYAILTAPGHPVFKTLTEKATKGLEKLLESGKLDNKVVLRDIMGNSEALPFTRVVLDHLSDVSGEYVNGDQMDRLDSPMLVGDVLVLPKYSFAWSSNDDLPEHGDDAILVERVTAKS